MRRVSSARNSSPWNQRAATAWRTEVGLGGFDVFDFRHFANRTFEREQVAARFAGRLNSVSSEADFSPLYTRIMFSPDNMRHFEGTRSQFANT